MPNCRNCGSRISKFDKDYCPICGCKKPLEGVESETVEITSQLNLDNADIKVKFKKRWVSAILAFFFGPLALPMFYLSYYKQGFIYLAINVGLFLAIFLPLVFINQLVLGLIISLSILYVAAIVIGIYILIKPSLKDGNGELVR